MSNAQISLNEFFLLSTKGLSRESTSALESTEKLKSLKDAVSKKNKEINWPVAFSEIMKKVEDLLNISMSDIMVRAWDKYQSVSEYIDRTKDSPDETFLLPLSEHTINSKHHPYVEILINDNPIGKIGFDINISLVLKGITLRIQDGKILEIFTGSCEGKGTITCENVAILEKKMEEIPLPHSIVLDDSALN